MLPICGDSPLTRDPYFGIFLLKLNSFGIVLKNITIISRCPWNSIVNYVISCLSTVEMEYKVNTYIIIIVSYSK